MFESALTIAGFLVGIVGMILAFLAYRKTQRRFRCSFATNQRQILKASDQLPDLAVSFQQSRVEALRAVDVAIVNSGTEHLSQDELLSSAPITIAFDGIPILGHEFVYISRPVCGFNIDYENVDYVTIAFDHMNKGDGCVIRFFVDETSETSVSVQGSLRKAGELTEIHQPKDRTTWLKNAGLLAFPVAMAAGLAAISNDKSVSAVPEEYRFFAYAAAILVVTGFVIISILGDKITTFFRKFLMTSTDPTTIPALQFVWSGKFPDIGSQAE